MYKSWSFCKSIYNQTVGNKVKSNALYIVITKRRTLRQICSTLCNVYHTIIKMFPIIPQCLSKYTYKVWLETIDPMLTYPGQWTGTNNVVNVDQNYLAYNKIILTNIFWKKIADVVFLIDEIFSNQSRYLKNMSTFSYNQCTNLVTRGKVTNRQIWWFYYSEISHRKISMANFGNYGRKFCIFLI